MKLFRKVNLDPRTRVPFEEWIQKINHFIAAGSLFKDESADPTLKEMFTLLPSFWHGMEPGERQVVMTIMESISYAWSADCIQQIMTECLITVGQMTDLRTCIIVARQHPESLVGGPVEKS
jgi:hypothetical protein